MTSFASQQGWIEPESFSFQNYDTVKNVEKSKNSILIFYKKKFSITVTLSASYFIKKPTTKELILPKCFFFTSFWQVSKTCQKCGFLTSFLNFLINVEFESNTFWWWVWRQSLFVVNFLLITLLIDEFRALIGFNKLWSSSQSFCINLNSNALKFSI